MTGHAFMYLPRGHALRLGPEPSEQACASTELTEWRAWYAWLVSTAIAHHTSPDPYRHLPVGDPYARGRGITGVVYLMLTREPLFAAFFFIGLLVGVAVIAARKVREHQRDLSWNLPFRKGE